ncbi:MAG: amino acid permease, partial [Ignavibacteriaceae bacterium]|nr:amino acid permease [Ignavibacteriaceae bacterium]
TMAGQLLSPELLLIIWIAAGLITFVGALANAEVAGMIDETGGQYIYFKEMYGKTFAYFYGWSGFAVIHSGSQAAIAYVFAEYVGYFFKYPSLPDSIVHFSIWIPIIGNIFPFAEFGTKAVAILCILFLTGINYVGVIFGGIVQTIITIIKIASIVLLSILLLTFGDGNYQNLSNGFQLAPQVSGNLFAIIGLALAGAFWAYDGWNNVTYVAGEIKNPTRNVPRALLYGTLIVVAVYVLTNIAYIYILPVEVMKNSPLVAATAAEAIFGKMGAEIIAIGVIISTFGACNGNLLTTSRIQFAMARQNSFFKSFGKIHPRYGTPHFSLVALGLWSCVLVLTGSFDTISDYVIFASWLFYMMGAYGVFILRKKMPDKPRPYKMWGYPWTPAIFVIFSFVFLINSLVADTQNSAMGLALILLGLPLYIFWRYKQKNDSQKDKD